LHAAEVIVTLPVEGRFHYSIPDRLLGRLAVGHRVLVPFGGRKVTGFVAAPDAEPPSGVSLKPILERLDEEPLLTPDLMAIVAFAADYYLAPVGEVLRIALPPGVTAASVAKYLITPAGKAALDSFDIESSERELLESLAKRGKRRAEISRSIAERLVERGLIALSESVAAKAVEDRIQLAELLEPPEKKPIRGPVQRKIAELLSVGPLPIEALAEDIPRASLKRALSALESDGRVRIVERLREQVEREGVDRGSALTLTQEQSAALAAIDSATDRKERAAFLLRGVTGSGKTEVYLRAISRVRALGRGAIVLVPEIALTAQLEARFRTRFGDQVVVLHSAVGDKERRKRWQQLRTGQANIALGPRSAVWAPVRNLGIVIVDEEHDPSFKQHSDLRYNGRDLALLRAHRAGAVAVLGSATPSLETRQLVESNRVVELRLAERVGGRPLPEITVIDLAKAREKERSGEIPLLTRPLADALRLVVSRKEQAIIFLNRRGFNTIVVCDECQDPRRCSHCDVSLTHHKAEGALICHYCGRREPFLHPCAKCKSRAMKPYGAGTERVFEAVHEAAPEARVLRLDRDVTSKTGALEEVLGQFRDRSVDVLVGTQMVTKGFDFPGVTLVGIICADTSLAFPDFRAAERTFQLMTQVAGRAGRADLPGRVIIQTFQPDHYALTCALGHDDERFFQMEIESRRRASYPPIARMGLIRLESSDLGKLDAAAREVAKIAREVADPRGLRLRGPVPAPIARIKDRHRKMLMLLAPTPATLVGAMRAIKDRLPRLGKVELVFDVDPLDLL
jgi:primosomal protein N' (replication factor Y) (superfamily II helicase)